METIRIEDELQICAKAGDLQHHVWNWKRAVTSEDNVKHSNVHHRRELEV